MTKRPLIQKIIPKKMGIYSLLFVFIFQLTFGLVSAITPQKAYADANFNSDISKYFKLKAFDICIEGDVNVVPNPVAIPHGWSTTPTINIFAGLSELIPVGAQSPLGYFDYQNVPVIDDRTFWAPSELGVSVSYSVAGDDGKWICGNAGHFSEWVKLIGYSSWKDWRDEHYERSGEVDNSLKSKKSRGTIISEVRDKIKKNLPSLSDAQKYVNYLRSFRKCTGPGQSSSNDVESPYVSIDNFVGEDGKVVSGTTYFSIINESAWPGTSEFSVGHGVGPADGRLTCEELADKLKSLKDSYAKYVADNPTDQPPGINPPGSSSLADDNSCEAKGGILSWIMCPITELLSSILNWIDTQLTRLLEVDRTKYASEGLYVAWSSFRNIALSLLVVTMVIMVAATALGIGALDAYTVKKAMPRMVAAVIFILLSWYICLTLIEISNVVGRGLLGVMTAPFGGKADSLASLFNPNAAGSIMQVFGGLGLIAAAALSPSFLTLLMSWVGTAGLILGIAFLTLVARQMFIIVLVLFAPLAILTWIFPGNDKPWKFWWQSFTKLLLMFPIVMALVASGRIFAGVISLQTVSGAEGIMNTLLKLTAYVVPYAFIPFTFKAAGGAFGNLTGMINDRSKGAFDRLRKGRENTKARMMNDAKTGQFFRGKNNPWNQRMQNLTNVGKAGIRPSRWRANIASETAKENQRIADEAMEKNEDVQQILQDDDMARSFTADRTREAIEARLLASGRFGDAGSQSLANAVATVERAQNSLKNAQSRRSVSAVARAATGTGLATHADMYQAAIDASGGDASIRNAVFAKMKSASERAGRFDLSAPGHVESLQAMDDLERGVPPAEINSRMRAEAMRTVGAGKLVQGKPGAVRDLTEGLADDYNAELNRTDGQPPDVNRLAELAGQITSLRAASGSATPEGREHINRMLRSVGIDESSSSSVDEQLGAQLGQLQWQLTGADNPPQNVTDQARVRAMNGKAGPMTEEDIATARLGQLQRDAINAVRTRSGAYDAGTGSRLSPAERAAMESERLAGGGTDPE